MVLRGIGLAAIVAPFVAAVRRCGASSGEGAGQAQTPSLRSESIVSIWRRLRVVAFIGFAAITLWIGWALGDDLHAAALAYDRSPIGSGTPSPGSTGIDWSLIAHSDYEMRALSDSTEAAWENAAKREIAAAVAFAIALVLLPTPSRTP